MSQYYSDLFQSISGSSGNTSWFAEWNNIKSGSYYKAAKAYVDKINSSNTTNATSSRTSKTGNVLDQILAEKRNSTVSKQTQTANSNLTSNMTSLAGSVATLQKDDTYTASNGTSAEDKVVSAMKDFVSQYNNVVATAKKSTLASQTSHIAAIMKTSESNSGKLAEIGITVNRDGTLQLNEDRLKSADLSKVKDLFSKDNVTSYGSTVMSRLTFVPVSSSAEKNTAKDDAKEDTAAASSAAFLETDSNALASNSLYGKIKGTDGTYQYNIEKILSTANSFVKNYNNMFDAAKSSTNSGVTSNLAQIKDKTAQNKTMLEQFGFKVDEKGKMTLDEDVFKKADMSKVQDFFKNYGSSIATNASLVDYYMTTQANTASGYTSDGTYNVDGSTRFNDIV